MSNYIPRLKKDYSEKISPSINGEISIQFDHASAKT